LAVTLPNFLILESLKQWDGFHATLLKKKIEWQDGWVIPSKEPGLGVELDEAVCEAHPYDSPHLHLQMMQTPLMP
jgi:L-alanine-DL-glutamate epimerase-like enolase superfamily enzyme